MIGEIIVKCPAFCIFIAPNASDMYIFNPEHDLCLANGDPNFVPPESALKFGRDCPGVVGMICGNEGDDGKVIPWGWDAVLRKRLLRDGVPEHMLPSERAVADIRELSHRRTSLRAWDYIRRHISDTGFLVGESREEIVDTAGLCAFLERHGSAVLKAPWSGSGKGLRWVSSDRVSRSDIGWCTNVIAHQGSLIAEAREEVVLDFGMLFRIGETGVSFEGYSLFHTDNGAYCSSVLASDGYIIDRVSSYVPVSSLLEVQGLLKSFMEHTFAGRYSGFLGVDMFVCRSGDRFLLAPCVEINVRMTMGLLARRLYDRLSCDGNAWHDAGMEMRVIYAPERRSLSDRLAGAAAVLTHVCPETRYAIGLYETGTK